MSGIDVVRELRRDPRTRGIRCILLTGADPNLVREATGGAFDALLAKPIDIKELTSAVSDCLGLLGSRASA
jgi:CheY-like chemotaxis protein